MFENLNPLDRSTAIYEIIIMLVGAFVIGTVVGRLLRRNRSITDTSSSPDERKTMSMLRLEIERLEKELKSAREQKGNVVKPDTAAQQALEAALAKAKQELSAVQAQADAERASNQAKEAALRELLKAAEASHAAQVQALEVKHEQQALALQAQQVAVGAAESEQVGLLRAQMQALVAAHSAKISDYEAVVQLQQEEMQDLKSRLAKPVSPTDSEEVAALRAQLEAVEARYKEETVTLQSQFWKKQAEAAELNVRLQALQKGSGDENSAMRAQLEQQLTELQGLQRKLAEVELKLGHAESELRAAQKALESAQTVAVKPSAQPQGLDKEMQWLRREKEDLEQDVKDLEARIDRLERENSELRAQARDKTSAGPALEKLTKERDKLKAELDRLRKQAATPTTEFDFSHLGSPTADQKDDLTRIAGIGPVVERKLNSLGLQTYAQLAQMSEADILQLDEALGLFPGRVKREQWVEQAKQLTTGN